MRCRRQPDWKQCQTSGILETADQVYSVCKLASLALVSAVSRAFSNPRPADPSSMSLARCYLLNSTCTLVVHDKRSSWSSTTQRCWESTPPAIQTRPTRLVLRGTAPAGPAAPDARSGRDATQHLLLLLRYVDRVSERSWVVCRVEPQGIGVENISVFGRNSGGQFSGDTFSPLLAKTLSPGRWL